MIASIQRNQANNTPRSENTKNDRNAAQGMGIGLTPKEPSWMCWLLLYVMWDVRATRLMWGMSSAASGWWVLITSRLWCASHKSRGSGIWWEVSELLLTCNLQLLNIDPWYKWCLRMFPWGKKPMHASHFCLVPEGTGQLNWTWKRQLDCWEKMRISGWELGSLPKRFVQFLGRLADAA